MKLGKVFSGLGAIAAAGLVLSFAGLGVKSFVHSYRTDTEKIIRRENCVVSDKKYFTATSHTETTPVYLALLGNAPFPFKMGEETRGYYIPERYSISFKCGEIELSIKGTEDFEKSMYERLNKGQNVRVFYQDVFKNSYVGGKLDKSDLIERVVLGAR